MKQYDKVIAEERVRDVNGTHTHRQEYGVSIVTSVEELKEIWDDAEARGYNQSQYGHGNIPEFTQYLQSKGINI